MTWLKYQGQVVADYPYDNAEGSRKHMFVLLVPNRYHSAYDRFIEGKYSEMYTDEQMSILFNDKNHTPALSVFNKTKEAKNKFTDNIHVSFGIPYADIEIMPEAELDFPIQKIKEIFNYEFYSE